VPDPGDPEPAYWAWLDRQEPDPAELADLEDRIDPDWDIPGLVVTEPAAPAADPAALDPHAPLLAPVDPAVLARLRANGDEAAPAVNYAAALNDHQRAAVQRPPGPLVIVAGPGTGKTRAITHRVAHLVATGAADPATILAVTFTRQAARELRRRLADLLDEDAAQAVTACTFHSLGYRILQAEAERLDLPGRFSVYGNGGGDALLRKALASLGLDERHWPLDRLREYISRAKSRLQTPEELLQVAGAPVLERRLAEIYQAYQEALREAHAVDYDDLLALPLRLLYGDRDVLAYWRERFQHVLVDEFQDTNALQYELLRALTQERQSLTVVCSPAQTIYTWRGADGPRVLARFQEDFPAAAQVVLGQHYRCTQTILTAAQALIQGRGYGEQALWTANPAGGPLTIVAAAAPAAEARFVVQEIAALREQGFAYRDVVILYRTRTQGREMERVLLRAGVPYLLVGEQRFFRRPEVRGPLAYLRLAHNPQDDVAVELALAAPPCRFGTRFKHRDVLTDRFGGVTLASLQAARTDGLPEWVQTRLAQFQAFVTAELPAARPSRTARELLDYVLDQPWYASWLRSQSAQERQQASLDTLRQIAGRYDYLPPADSLAGFLAEIWELEEHDLWDVPLEEDGGRPTDDPGSVILSTIHAAKGREYPVVFVVGCEEGLLPHVRSAGTDRELEEERRLAYVALTRAQQRLYLSFAQERVQGDGAVAARRPSRFLGLLPRATWVLRKN